MHDMWQTSLKMSSFFRHKTMKKLLKTRNVGKHNKCYAIGSDVAITINNLVELSRQSTATKEL